MAPVPHKRVVIILGASGKVGRMLRAVWKESPPKDFDFIYVYRSVPQGKDGVVWAPGLPTDHLPKAQAIVALWGATPRSEYRFSDNTDLAIATLELARDLQVERVLHCSSAAVYSPSPEPLTEIPTGPAPNDYGQSKLDMEHQITQWISENEGLFSNVIMRLANVAGADGLFNNMKPGKSVTLDRFADGQGPRRSYIGVTDLAKVIEALIMASRFDGPINIAATKATEMSGLASAAGCSVKWKPAPDGAIASVTLDTTRLQSVLKLDDSSASPENLIECAQKGGVWP